MSLPDTITVQPDANLSDQYANDSVFTRLGSEGLTKSTYVENSHTPVARNLLHYYTSPAKPNGISRGSHKCSVKHTLDKSVPNRSGDGNIVLPMIGQLSLSIPTGVNESDRKAFLQRIAASIMVPETVVTDTPGDIIVRLTNIGEI